MNYLKSLFFNFLTVFFANYALPGIEIVHQTKLPYIGGDFLFAIGVGILNSLIFPVLKLLERPTNIKQISLSACGIAFGSYTILKFAPIGIEITSIPGFFLASTAVGLGGFLTSFFEMRRSMKYSRPPELSRMS
jgi:hypothetical protein